MVTYLEVNRMQRINERVFSKKPSFRTRQCTADATSSPNQKDERPPSMDCRRNMFSLERMCSRTQAESVDTKTFVFGGNDVGRKLVFLLLRIMLGGVLGFLAILGLICLVAHPPMHWFYEVGVAAGPASICLPGGGFSGFWFHLGYLHSFQENRDLHDYDYYCFSAACLSVLSVFLNRTVEEVYETAMISQNAWMNGNRSRFEIVDYFLEELMPLEAEDDCTPERISGLWLDEKNDSKASCDPFDFLPRLKILVTTSSDAGYAILEPTSRSELKEHILRTTWVPYVTGSGIRMPNSTEQEPVYLDGAFSRTLHPECEASWTLPIMWETLVHTFSPGLSREQVHSLWEHGKKYEYPIPASSRTSAAVATNNSVESDGSCFLPSSVPK